MNDQIAAKRHAEAALATGNNSYGFIEVEAEQLRVLINAFPESPMDANDWEAAMDAERIRQVEAGFDDAHDDAHGARALLNWAIDYSRRGKPLAAATMTRCALRLLAGATEWKPVVMHIAGGTGTACGLSRAQVTHITNGVRFADCVHCLRTVAQT